jgi:hypothetical protein
MAALLTKVKVGEKEAHSLLFKDKKNRLSRANSSFLDIL